MVVFEGSTAETQMCSLVSPALTGYFTTYLVFPRQKLINVSIKAPKMKGWNGSNALQELIVKRNTHHISLHELENVGTVINTCVHFSALSD